MDSTKNSKKSKAEEKDKVKELQRKMVERNQEHEDQLQGLAEQNFRLRRQLTKVRLAARHTIDSPDEKVATVSPVVPPPAQSSTAVMDNTGTNNGTIHIEHGQHIKIPIPKAFPRHVEYSFSYDLEKVQEQMPARRLQTKTQQKQSWQLRYLIKKNKDQKPLTPYDVYLVVGYSQLSTSFQPVDGPTFYSLYEIPAPNPK
ncbi:unnamed protein product [Bursaphelenchus okinawaensis]|uniref:Uncharacterized protein n=1 Tax=Bursaphelenchus okinawaensis TaxID=465554 RepID=A0A811JQ13_9BILA|nr:unnamed protein product [Bursaphelenchus okinawaensis]CAG9077512.1 unnamed protein product [Bursaphelenchus okinawaensis]